MIDKQIKVLLIEDNPRDARLIGELLFEVDRTLFDLETACRLSDGLTRLQKGGIDAVLLDLELPDSAGLDTFERVHDQAPGVPIVMLTGINDAELALEIMRRGAQDYLVKGRADGDLLTRTLRYAIERKVAEARIEHLNSVLNAIRNVNQLIVSETEPDSLLKKSCDALVNARGYDAVWLGAIRDDGTFDMVVGSGFREDVAHFSDRVAGGDLPPCIRDAFAKGELVWVPDGSRKCGGCFFKDVCLGKEALILHVEHAGRLFGMLAVLLAPGVAVDDEETGLLLEVASDIGIALHNRELEGARKRAENALTQSEERFRMMFENMGNAVVIYDAVDEGNDFIFKDFNRAAETIEKIRREDLIGKSVLDIFPGVVSFGLFDLFQRVWQTGEPEHHPISFYEDIRTVGWRENYVYKLPSGEIVVIYEDVTERKAADDALNVSEGKYRALFEAAKDAIFLNDETGKFIDVNSAACGLLGYSKEELLKLSNKEIDADPRGYEAFLKVRKGLIKEAVFEVNQRRKDGTLVPVEISGESFKVGGSKLFLAISRDITERKAADDALKESEVRYKRLYSMVRMMCDNLPDLMWTKDLDDNFIFVNKSCCDVLLNAIDTDEPIGKDDLYFASRERKAHPENPDYHTFGERCICSDLVVMATKKPQRFAEFGNLKGEFIYLDVYKAPFGDEEDNLMGTVGCARIITKEKQAEEQIRQSLQEKEVMLREIHHRVKNNLQVVSSLLNIQARNVGDKNTVEILYEARDRIKTMSLIHSQLYEGSDLAGINMKEFVDRLLGQLLQSHPVRDARIVHVVRVDDYPFPISVAVPVGLIINELLSNTLKHAFDGRDEGNIEISLTASASCRINLTVSDDGVGLPPGFDIDKSKALGLHLVNILAKDQLQGTLEVISEEGATFRIEFDLCCDESTGLPGKSKI